jgi:hypothetical protein
MIQEAQRKFPVLHTYCRPDCRARHLGIHCTFELQGDMLTVRSLHKEPRDKDNRASNPYDARVRSFDGTDGKPWTKESKLLPQRA